MAARCVELARALASLHEAIELRLAVSCNSMSMLTGINYEVFDWRPVNVHVSYQSCKLYSSPPNVFSPKVGQENLVKMA